MTAFTGSEKRPWRALRLWLVTVPLSLACCGCPFAPLPTDADPDTGSDGDVPYLDVSGNASLNTATALALDPAGELTFRGSIEGSMDIDVFELGTLSPGDGVFVDVQRTSGDLDPVAAIFDSREYLIAFNDDRTPDSSNLNPQIDFVLAGDKGMYYLAIIAYPGLSTTGDYEAAVRIDNAVGVPSPQIQIVYLDWDGADKVQIPNVGTFSLPPFSASDVGLSVGQTESLKDRIQAIIEDRYAGFGLLLLNSDDHEKPDVPHSTVYFGSSDRRAFAIAEKIDSYNEDPADDAIVFTESYRDAFGLGVTLEEMAQAIGNTVSHEVAHLLGLVHTQDCDSLMDTSCYNDRLLSPQEFKTAVLDDSVFPFGYQATEEILEWILGLVGL